MRISDWSSDVCSSDLGLLNKLPGGAIFTLPGEDNAVPDFLSRYRNQTTKAGDYVRGYERLGVSQPTLTGIGTFANHPIGAAQILWVIHRKSTRPNSSH